MSYAILFLAVGIALAMLEVLIPSGGVLGVLSAAAIIGSLVLAFKEDTSTGVTFLIIVVVFVPTVIIVGLKIFPKTPIGKKLILAPSVESEIQRGSAGVGEEDYSNLMGKTGKTITPLRPSGIAEIDGRRYSVVAEGELIDNKTDIVVVEIEGNNIVVDQKNA